MPEQADTRYAHRPWDAMNISPEPVDHLMAAGPPTMVDPMILFPPREGLFKTAIGVADVFSTTNLYPDARYEVSGGPAGYSGSPRNALGNVFG